MKYLAIVAVSIIASLVFGLDGQIGIHDPSTVIWCSGKYYTYGTGGNSLVSDDGWTWRRGTPLPRRGLAPDVIHIGDRYYVYVAANSGPSKADVNMIWSKTLDMCIWLLPVATSWAILLEPSTIRHWCLASPILNISRCSAS